MVRAFLEGYEQGGAPNPCLACNRTIRWEFLLNHALALGAESMATGHYARRREDGQGSFQLLRAFDPKKDQSYILHLLTQEKLARALFPVGEYAKSEVRELAARFGLPTADRAESQDLCFLAGEDYRQFLKRNAPQIGRPGEIVDQAGRVLGQHQGLAFYTIGQRKGLNLASSTPLYVIGKDRSSNALVVGIKEELGSRELHATEVNWIAGRPPEGKLHLEVTLPCH